MAVARGKGSLVAVVLLGWLGARPKHLKRYVEMYNARGVHVVTFVALVNGLLFDWGRKLEERIGALAQELCSWLAEIGNDRRQPALALPHLQLYWLACMG